MPYIVITKQRPTFDTNQPLEVRSRRAVSTLEEARREAGRACLGSTSLDLRNVEQARTLPESGGTVGPLPDGTVIEVERCLWTALSDLAGLNGWEPAPEDWQNEVLDAFNARQS